MKIICDKKHISQKVTICQKAINNKSSNDILKCFLIQAKNGVVKLISYDLDMAIETTIEAQIIKEGVIAVNARLFGDIVRKLPDTLIEIEIDLQNNIFIKYENSKFEIKGHSPDEFPKLPEVKKNNLHSISQNVLKNMIKQTVFAISQDSTKQILMGELLEITNNKVSLVAIDGYRLAVRSYSINKNFDDIKIIIPGKNLNDLNSLLSTEGVVEIGFDDKNAIFIFDNIKMIIRLLEGDFIDYKKLLPREHNTKIKVNTKDFLNSIERASLLSQSDKNNLIKLSIREKIVAITSNTDKGNVYEEVQISLEGDYLDIAFNSRYLIEGLRNIESEYIYLEFTTNINPCIIKPIEDIEYNYLLLPVRITSN